LSIVLIIFSLGSDLLNLKRNRGTRQVTRSQLRFELRLLGRRLLVDYCGRSRQVRFDEPDSLRVWKNIRINFSNTHNINPHMLTCLLAGPLLRKVPLVYSFEFDIFAGVADFHVLSQD
jgi:hypothetical protein